MDYVFIGATRDYTFCFPGRRAGLIRNKFFPKNTITAIPRDAWHAMLARKGSEDLRSGAAFKGPVEALVETGILFELPKETARLMHEGVIPFANPNPVRLDRDRHSPQIEDTAAGGEAISLMTPPMRELFERESHAAAEQTRRSVDAARLAEENALDAKPSPTPVVK